MMKQMHIFLTQFVDRNIVLSCKYCMINKILIHVKTFSIANTNWKYTQWFKSFYKDTIKKLYLHHQKH